MEEKRGLACVTVKVVKLTLRQHDANHTLRMHISADLCSAYRNQQHEYLIKLLTCATFISDCYDAYYFRFQSQRSRLLQPPR